MSQARTVSGLSDKEKARIRFGMYLRASLKSFQKNNPSAVRKTADGGIETELTALRRFLDAALDGELAEEFGDVPDFDVT